VNLLHPLALVQAQLQNQLQSPHGIMTAQVGLARFRKNPEISGKAFLIYYEPLSPPHKKCFDLALVEPTSPCPPTTEGRFEQFDL